MRKRLGWFCTCGLLGAGLLFGLSSDALAGEFFDDFNDGNADGWMFAPNARGDYGDWRVENGTLVQYSTGDHYMGLVENLQISDQAIEVDLNTLGYAGVVFWRTDNHWVAVMINSSAGIWILEFFNGTGTTYYYDQYWIARLQWYNLRVEAKSATGELRIYLTGYNDTDISFTHTVNNVSKKDRTGLSGVWSGNEVGYFDSFRLTSKDIRSVSQAGTGGQGGKITAPVPQTGQLNSYYPGDDGDHQAGVPWPTPRFTDRGDGTVRDNLTGLIWMKNANCAGPKTWTEAVDFCNDLADNMCDLNDGSVAGNWRLPNVHALSSLTHWGFWNPALPNTVGTGQCSQGDPFLDVMLEGQNFYWTSTTYLFQNDPGTLEAWTVPMSSGGIVDKLKSYAFYVWCVRDAQ